jgi:hypothetical protein
MKLSFCKPKGIVVGNKQELKGKTYGYIRYIAKEGLLEGFRWQTNHQIINMQGEGGTTMV